MILQSSFYTSRNVTTLSRDLLGKYVFTNFSGVITGGMIVETEAYQGTEDRGSHAYGGRFTPRTEIMYGQAGHSYVYLCYGIHHLFNVVAGDPGVPHAVLVRAIQPTKGIDAMLERRNLKQLNYRLTAGPGALASALGLNRTHNAIPLDADQVWLEEFTPSPCFEIAQGARVGMNFDGPWKTAALRFWIKGNPWVSRAK